ncbi:hypothetical protein ACQ33O_05630 [Ferruginibacter sp. SUN002]|uniref:hypothetical protein n=1 Tax=Ferruginibacter sp. SUN002 TaxID=2937789 RepID=UPI003D3606E4
MKHILLLLICLMFTGLAVMADFGISASAVYLEVNGTASFYNTQKSNTQSPISTYNLNNQLGVFGFKSGNLVLNGAEVRVIRNGVGSICNGNLYYAVYPEDQRPDAPTFKSISLAVACSCNGTTFSSCGGGACTSVYEQKLQTVGKAVDLTDLEAGDYTLELYYDVSGDNSGVNCSIQHVDNANGVNYRANFTVSAPLSVNLSAFGAICTDQSVKLKWSIQNDQDIVKYEIEKSSTGLVFTPIGSVNANSVATSSNYAFIDNNPIVGTNYYRMKVYHKNTAVNVSSIVRIYFGKVGNTIFIYPNPSGSELAVRFAAVTKGRYQMSVLSNDGRRLLTQTVEHDGTDKTLKINMPGSLPKGVYRLFLIDRIRFYKQAFLIK